MKYLLIPLLLIIVRFTTKAQEKQHFYLARNSIQFEIPSHTIYSLSYERILVERKKIAWSGRIGLGAKGGREHRQGVFVDFGAITGKRKHHFEAGFQVAYIRTKIAWGKLQPTDPDYPPWFQYKASPRLGYRYQNSKSGWIFRANALFDLISNDYIKGRTIPRLVIPIPFPVLTIGRSF